MSKIKFKLNINGLRQLMKSADMRQAVNAVGVSVENKARVISGGENFTHDTKILDFVAITTVYPDSKSAASAVYRDNILEKSLSGLPRKK